MDVGDDPDDPEGPTTEEVLAEGTDVARRRDDTLAHGLFVRKHVAGERLIDHDDRLAVGAIVGREETSFDERRADGLEVAAADADMLRDRVLVDPGRGPAVDLERQPPSGVERQGSRRASRDAHRAAGAALSSSAS